MRFMVHKRRAIAEYTLKQRRISGNISVSGEVLSTFDLWIRNAYMNGSVPATV